MTHKATQKPEWNYTAWNTDSDREATDTEVEWIGWPRPTWSDELVKQGPVPADLEVALHTLKVHGVEGALSLFPTTPDGATIEIELQL